MKTIKFVFLLAAIFLFALVDQRVEAIYCGDGADSGTCAWGIDVDRTCCSGTLAGCIATCPPPLPY